MRNKWLPIALGILNAAVFAWLPFFIYDVALRMGETSQSHAGTALPFAFLTIVITFLINAVCMFVLFKKRSSKPAVLGFLMLGWAAATVLLVILSQFSGFFAADNQGEESGIALFLIIICYVVNVVQVIASYLASLFIHTIFNRK